MTRKGVDMGKNILPVFRLSQRLMRGSRGRLYLLLTTVVLFNIEVVLMVPIVLKYGFLAVAEKNVHALVWTAIGGSCAFAFNFAVMYFINVYGDAWATKFAFHAAENGFKEISRLPVASIQAAHNDDDLFNRIAAGTGNIMGFYFSMANLIGNGIAVVVLIVILCRFSGMLGGFVLLLVAVELLVVRLQFRYNAGYTGKMQEDKAKSIRQVRSLLEQSSFHQHNQTGDWIRGLYGEARAQWFQTQEKRILTSTFLDSCLVSIHGLFKMGLVRSFMIKQEIFSSYADDVASSFSTFGKLVEKAKEFGGTVSRLPNSFVPIEKLGDVLTDKPQQAGGREEGRLTLEHISVVIRDKEIVKDACCRIPLGNKVAVIGENGSGKSTWLKAVAGLHQRGDGNVHDLGRKAAYMPADELLFRGHSVSENLSYGGDGIGSDAIKKLLEELRFSNVEDLCGKTPEQLSGGEAKRINIARGLLGDAEVILADEPTGCLDREASGIVMEKLLKLEGKTVIYITHDPEYAQMADEVIFMQDGEIRQIFKGAECADNAYFQRWREVGKRV